MPHVTFIHGIANKPPKEKLLEHWLHALSMGGLDLDTNGVTSSMVYWADVMYKAPLKSDDQFESVDTSLGTEPTDEDLSWIASLSDEEKAFVERFRKKLDLDAPSPEGDSYQPPLSTNDEQIEEQVNFEAIPLPWFIKRRVMKVLLKDVHHYLFNASFSPRAGAQYQVQDEIRQRFVTQLEQDSTTADGVHIVVGHSMGTVISYDCLKNVDTCPKVTGFMTVGSPLGLSEVHDNYSPAYSQRDGFPNSKVNGDWVNMYDRLDPVALDARIANDYQHNGKKVVMDTRVKNNGVWRHSSEKYFAQSVLADKLRVMLAL